MKLNKGDFMKWFLTLIFCSSMAFGSEVKTECPMMREMMRRDNPKAQNKLLELKIKNNLVSAQTSRQ
jgi:hypothetical protein